MQNEKIIQAIAAYLERNTLITSVSGEKPFECRYQFAAEQIAAAIAPHLEAGADWENAPPWAEWRTVDKNNVITFWDEKPRISEAGYWTMQGTDGTKWEEVGQDETWKHSLQSRPR